MSLADQVLQSSGMASRTASRTRLTYRSGEPSHTREWRGPGDLELDIISRHPVMRVFRPQRPLLGTDTSCSSANAQAAEVGPTASSKGACLPAGGSGHLCSSRITVTTPAPRLSKPRPPDPLLNKEGVTCVVKVDSVRDSGRQLLIQLDHVCLSRA